MEELNHGEGTSRKSPNLQAKTIKIFQSEMWKVTGLAAFVAMNIAGLIVTVSLTAAVSAIGGNSGSVPLATHTFSLKHIQYWLLGVAGISFIIDGVAVLACMVKNRIFRIAVISLLAVTIVLTISLAIWGSADEQGRRSYFQYTWDKMDSDTKHLFQDYYSCCGFEDSSEWLESVLARDESCFARYSTTLSNITWPDGCYERIVKTYLDPVTVVEDGETFTFGDTKANPFYVSFVFVFTLLTIMQTTMLILFAVSIKTTTMHSTSSTAKLTIENPYATPDELSSKANGLAVIDNGMNGSVNDDSERKQGSDSQDATRSCPTRFADSISNGFSDAFYWLGIRVAEHPKMTIFLSILVVGTLSVGMAQRYEPDSGIGGGFLSEDSRILTETSLMRSIFFIAERDQFIMVIDESNVLSNENFMKALDIDRSIKSINTNSEDSLSTICLKIGNTCKQRSLFELWSFNDTVLDRLNDSAVITKVNEDDLVSPVFGDAYDINQVIGGLTKDGSNDITAARAHLLHYVTRTLNQDWEDLFLEIAQKTYDGVEVHGLASNSRRQESGNSFRNDLPLFFVGFVFIFIYILVMTGKFSLIEHRVYIALLGVAAAGLSMSAGIGLTSCCGLPWTNLHLIVPFLAIGIGVDDMFVILQAWDTIQDDSKYKHLSIKEKAGKTLQTAGVSITVTSMTDLVAFAVGATSELAGFASFSVFVAVCIIILFFLECTFFLSCVVLDERRKENRYDACLACCYQHDENYKPSKCGQRQILQTVFEDGLGRAVSYVPFAAIVICITLSVAGVMAWGFYKLQVRYDPDWYIPTASYVVTYGKKYEEFFSPGADASVYVLNADFFSERQKLSNLFTSLQNNPDLNSAFGSSWFDAYISWKNTISPSLDVMDDSSYAGANDFYTDVKSFLSDPSGIKYIYDVQFENGSVIGSKFDIRHRMVEEQADNVDIIASVRKNCEDAQFDSGASVFPFGSLYYIYEITRIIRQEVYRNIGITMLCVFLMVIPMLASLQMGILVALCVAITTVDVAGTMYFAGLSIEASTIITLLLSIGLAVDYAAHIGHKFLTIKGTRQMRTRVAVGQIGLAVFNGGFSTFLALAMLAFSSTYTYKVFFTVFVCVVGYGLWNGLVFLPCLLAIVGPDPHANAVEARLSSKHYEQNGKVDTSNSVTPRPQSVISRH